MNIPMQNQAPPAQMQTQFNTPPPFGFGMPPPNYMYPPNPWSMPWQQPMPQMSNDKSRMVDPQVKHRLFDKNKFWFLFKNYLPLK